MTEIEFYTPQDLARLAGVSDRYITKLCRSGELRAQKAGRKNWIIPKQVGDRWLKERRNK